MTFGELKEARVMVTAGENPLPPAQLDVTTLRALFRGIPQFRVANEDHGIAYVTGPDRREWALVDIEYLYSESQRILPPKQAASIELFLVGGLFEADVAEMLGTTRENPIGMYATKGLQTMIRLIRSGSLSRYKED